MADAWGLSEGYYDISGQWHPTNPDVDAAIRAAFDADGDQPPDPPGMWFVRDSDAHELWSPADLELEDGTTLEGVRRLPPDLPIGRHWLHPTDGWPAVQVLRVPPRCPAPPERTWAVAAQVYALRSRQSWGIGDLADLRTLSESFGVPVLCSPFHGGPPVPPLQPSPYYASSRLFWDLLLLTIDEVTGRNLASAAVTVAAQAAAELNRGARIQRDQVLALKLQALEAIWRQWRLVDPHDPALTRYRQDTPHLEAFATFCALSEIHGRQWRNWPVELRHPDAAAVAEAGRRLAERVSFHAWCQYELDQQLRRAGRRHGLIGDLAVGFDPDGFDAWLFQDHLAPTLRIGAPGDSFNPAGQDWGLPPFVPWKLRRARYEPFLDTVTAAMAHVAGLRIDHVLGLFRLYCIPMACDSGGAYVHYNHDDLLDLVMLAAHRAGAFVVGEDLGTVPAEVRHGLDDRGMLGCRVAVFDDQPPAKWPSLCLATATTHDLPTVAGALSGRDHDHRVAAGTRSGAVSDTSSGDPMVDRLVAHGDLPATSVSPTSIAAVYEALAASACELVAVTAEDLIGSTEPPNIPGTIDEWPNWRLRLPVDVEQMADHPVALAVVAAITRGRSLPPAR